MSDMILKAPSAWRTLSRNLLLWFALFVVALLVLAMIAGPWISPHDPDLVELSNRLQEPDSQYWLGTDHLGRDIFSRLIAGARISLGTVAITLVIIMTLGLVIGGIAGFTGGRADQIIMRFPDTGTGTVFNRHPRYRADKRDYRDRTVTLGVVCADCPRDHPLAAPPGISAGRTSERRRKCADLSPASVSGHYFPADRAGDPGYRPYDAACLRAVIPRAGRGGTHRRVGRDDQRCPSVCPDITDADFLAGFNFIFQCDGV